MLEFVDSDLYFVQDKNYFITPLLQVGSGSGSVKKLPDPDPHPGKNGQVFWTGVLMQK